MPSYFLKCNKNTESKKTKVARAKSKESSRKPDKIWIDNSSEFYNRSMKS